MLSMSARRLSSAAWAAGPRQQQVSRLDDGLTVQSVDNGAPLASIVVAYRAGTRYEQADEPGLVHHIRNLVGKDSARYPGCQLVWQTAAEGAELHAVHSRDLLAVQVQVPRSSVPVAVSLSAELSRPAMKAWDLSDRVDTVRADRLVRDRLGEMLHRAAYRNGSLAQPLLAPSYAVGKYNYTQLEDFAAAHMTTGSCVITGVNVNHDDLVAFAANQAAIPAVKGGRPPVPCPFLGGEVRKSAGGSRASVALVGEAVGVQDPRTVAAQAVFAAIVDRGSVSLAVAKAANMAPGVRVAAVHELHSDTGLLGVRVEADGHRMHAILSEVVKAVKALASDIDATELAAARRSAAVAVLTRAEKASELSLDAATQLLATGEVVSPSEMAHMIATVSENDVNKVASTVMKRLALAAIGDLSQTPYLSDL